jgi:hypothetical protein
MPERTCTSRVVYRSTKCYKPRFREGSKEREHERATEVTCFMYCFLVVLSVYMICFGYGTSVYWRGVQESRCGMTLDERQNKWVQ